MLILFLTTNYSFYFISFLQYAKLILPHVGLVVLTCAYTIVGAAIFFCVENPNEKATKRQQLDIIFKKQDYFVSQILNLVSKNESNAILYQDLASQHLHNMSDHLFIAYEKFFLTANEVKFNKTHEIWTFSTAVFFAVTVVTTIGMSSVFFHNKSLQKYICNPFRLR